MKVLLDTHTFLWLESEPAQLSSTARQILANAQNVVLLSYVSLWEIQIKTALGKLQAELPFLERVALAQTKAHLTLLPITIDHLAALGSLPIHHRDPFDRLLIAQAIVENIPLISKDERVGAYPITVIW